MSEENKDLRNEENNFDSYPQDSLVENESEKTDVADEALEEVTADISESDSSGKKPKKSFFGAKISVGAYLFSTVAIILATLLVTYSACAEIFKSKYADNIVVQEQIVEKDPPKTGIDLIDQYLEANFYGEYDTDLMMTAALKAYVAATGDPYARYYTFEELLEDIDETASRMCGVGVNIAYEFIEYKGETIASIHIFNVMTGSPALEAGLLKGDRIINVKTEEGVKTVTELGYAGTLEVFLGEEGTFADFVVLRENAEGEYEEKSFKIERKQIESETVYIETLEEDPSIGLIKLLEFNYKTPVQFENKMDQLVAAGIKDVVIDLRSNPGGNIISVAAVLSFFMNEGDVYIHMKDVNGQVTSKAIAPITYDESADKQGCNVYAENIGKYKDLNLVVLCNERTGSAAELFIANFKDYDLGKVVGTKTYGKGCVQNYFLLNGGYMGAIKITTDMYFSGGDTELVGYDQVGITPDEVVPLDEKFANMSVYIVPQDEDAQLKAALAYFK